MLLKTRREELVLRVLNGERAQSIANSWLENLKNPTDKIADLLAENYTFTRGVEYLPEKFHTKKRIISALTNSRSEISDIRYIKNLSTPILKAYLKKFRLGVGFLPTVNEEIFNTVIDVWKKVEKRDRPRNVLLYQFESRIAVGDRPDFDFRTPENLKKIIEVDPGSINRIDDARKTRELMTIALDSHFGAFNFVDPIDLVKNLVEPRFLKRAAKEKPSSLFFLFHEGYSDDSIKKDFHIPKDLVEKAVENIALSGRDNAKVAVYYIQAMKMELFQGDDIQSKQFQKEKDFFNKLLLKTLLVHPDLSEFVTTPRIPEHIQIELVKSDPFNIHYFFRPSDKAKELSDRLIDQSYEAPAVIHKAIADVDQVVIDRKLDSIFEKEQKKAIAIAEKRLTNPENAIKDIENFDEFIKTAYPDIDNTLVKILDEANTSHFMSFHFDNLEDLIDRGRTETGDKPASIKQIEKDQFNAKEGARSYVNYGFIDKKGSVTNNFILNETFAGREQTVYIEFKPHVRKKATVTLGDSFQHYIDEKPLVPVPLGSPDHRLLLGRSRTSIDEIANLKNDLANAEKDKRLPVNPNKLVKKITFDPESYDYGGIETQIYGRITLDDIQSIAVVTIDQQKKLRKMLDNAGYKEIEVLSHPNVQLIKTLEDSRTLHRFSDTFHPDDIDVLSNDVISNLAYRSNAMNYLRSDVEKPKHLQKLIDDYLALGGDSVRDDYVSLDDYLSLDDLPPVIHTQPVEFRNYLKGYYDQIRLREKSGMPQYTWEAIDDDALAQTPFRQFADKRLFDESGITVQSDRFMNQLLPMDFRSEFWNTTTSKRDWLDSKLDRDLQPQYNLLDYEDFQEAMPSYRKTSALNQYIISPIGLPRALRLGIPLNEEQKIMFNDFKRVLSDDRAKLDTDLIVYRADDLARHRGKREAAELINLKPGDNLQLKSFTSTTIDPAQLKPFGHPDGIIFNIFIPKGNRVINFNSGEGEFLLPPNTKFAVRKTEDFDSVYGKKVISLEVVEQAEELIDDGKVVFYGPKGVAPDPDVSTEFYKRYSDPEFQNKANKEFFDEKNIEAKSISIAPNMDFIEADQDRNASFRVETNGSVALNIGKENLDLDAGKFTWMHEHGHYIDFEAGKFDVIDTEPKKGLFGKIFKKKQSAAPVTMASNTAEFQDALESDYSKGFEKLPKTKRLVAIFKEIEDLSAVDRNRLIKKKFKQKGMDYGEAKKYLENYGFLNDNFILDRNALMDDFLMMNFIESFEEGNVFRGVGSIFGYTSQFDQTHGDLVEYIKKSPKHKMPNYVVDGYLDPDTASDLGVKNTGAIQMYSDLLGLMTNNQVQFGYGHDAKYFQHNPRKRKAEMFANMFAIRGESEIGKQLIDTFLPASSKAVTTIQSRFIKNMEELGEKDDFPVQFKTDALVLDAPRDIEIKEDFNNIKNAMRQRDLAIHLDAVARIEDRIQEAMFEDHKRELKKELNELKNYPETVIKLIDDPTIKTPEDLDNLLLRTFSPERVSPYMAMTESSLSKAVAENQFKNALQAGRGTFSYGDERFDDERRMFLLPDDAEDDRQWVAPKYGFLANAGVMDDFDFINSGYGDILIKFKPNVLQRTTVNLGDSLNLFGEMGEGGMLLINPSNPTRFLFSALLTADNFPYFKYSPHNLRAWARDEDYDFLKNAFEDATGLQLPYVETQMYGKLLLDDVEEIQVSTTSALRTVQEILEGNEVTNIPVVSSKHDKTLYNLSRGVLYNDTVETNYHVNLTPTDISRLGDDYMYKIAMSNMHREIIDDWKSDDKDYPVAVNRKILEIKKQLGPGGTCDMLPSVNVDTVRRYVSTFYKEASEGKMRNLNFIGQDWKNVTDDVINKDLLDHYPSRAEMLSKYGKN